MPSSTSKITDMYMRVLEHLSPEDTLDLISKLIDSMRNKKTSGRRLDKSEIYASFSGECPDMETVPEETSESD